MSEHKMTDEEHVRLVAQRRRDRMREIDSYPEPIRKLIHDYGLMTVKAFLDLNIPKPQAHPSSRGDGTERVQPNARIVVSARCAQSQGNG